MSRIAHSLSAVVAIESEGDDVQQGDSPILAYKYIGEGDRKRPLLRFEISLFQSKRGLLVNEVLHAE